MTGTWDFSFPLCFEALQLAFQEQSGGAVLRERIISADGLACCIQGALFCGPYQIDNFSYTVVYEVKPPSLMACMHMVSQSFCSNWISQTKFPFGSLSG